MAHNPAELEAFRRQAPHWSVHHALRAHTLLEEADVELAGAPPAQVPARVSHRVNLAIAHAQAADVLSTLSLPANRPLEQAN